MPFLIKTGEFKFSATPGCFKYNYIKFNFTCNKTNECGAYLFSVFFFFWCLFYFKICDIQTHPLLSFHDEDSSKNLLHHLFQYKDKQVLFLLYVL